MNTNYNVNEIMKNWKDFTGFDTVQDYSDEYDSNEFECFESEEKIMEFCEYYNYGFNDIFNILWHN